MVEHAPVPTVSSESYSVPDGPIILLHGGAWDIPDAEVPDYRTGMRSALDAGIECLQCGASATEVVVAVIASMEDSGSFDAGRGSVLRTDGTAVLDAGLMNGVDSSFGSVGAVRRVRNPIAFADTLRRKGAGIVRFAAGEDAELLAAEMGHQLVAPEYQICDRERARFDALQSRQRYHTSTNFVSDEVPRGTVGCVVLDAAGNLAAGTSTGGTPLSPPGRIGDTPLPGCGFYCTRRAGASATGWGEAIATVNLCARVVDDGSDATRDVRTILTTRLESMYDVVKNPSGGGATGGAITIRENRTFGWAYSTPRMARAFWTPEQGRTILI